MLYSCQFVKKVSDFYQARLEATHRKVRTDFVCHRFISKLERAYSKTCAMIPTRKGRYSCEGDSAINLMTKVIHKHTQAKAESVIIDSLAHIYPVLLVRHSMTESKKYRLSIRLIQRVWKTKYHGRIYCLLYFVDNHVEKMMVEYPHFQIFLDNFYKTSSNRQICLDYIKDESEKYRYIYEAYKHKLEEIAEMEKLNIKHLNSKKKGEK